MRILLIQRATFALCLKCLVLFSITGVLAQSVGPQPRKKETVPLSPPKKEVSSGYLSKSPPALRFSPPPKPPVPSLPPLPITHDPQPEFAREFAPQTLIVPRPEPGNTNRPVGPETRLQLPGTVSVINTNQSMKIPIAPPDPDFVNPKMLVRFFQSGKPSEVELLLNSPVAFQVPINSGPVPERRSSSATYKRE